MLMARKRHPKHQIKACCALICKSKYLLWMGSGPLGTFLLLSWKGSSALKSSRVLCSPSALSSILLPPIAASLAGRAALSPSSMTNAINTSDPNKMANAAARLTDPAGLLMTTAGRRRAASSSSSSLSPAASLHNTSSAAALLRASSHGDGVAQMRCNAAAAQRDRIL
ncbi:hypothetical protein C2845_PM01G23080 [Panicum miliaceum]|uniref:Uncharacterized protein n=1 Tax=Panicum miliaceum TaxID=4540 RepID=A0A3L6TPF7_PANMI|nr:hypothetical protein C2845_PM01G23080 [Panicum miliaceum]